MYVWQVAIKKNWPNFTKKSALKIEFFKKCAAKMIFFNEKKI